MDADPLEDPGPSAAAVSVPGGAARSNDDDDDRDAAEAETLLMDVAVVSPASAEPAPAAGDAPSPKGRSLLMPYWRLLRTNTDFALLFTANVIVELGNWFNFVATLNVLSAATGASTLTITYYSLVQAVPPLVLGPLIGIVVDRTNKKSLMIWTSLIRALAVVALIFVQGPDGVPWVYVLTFLKFAFSAFYMPARTAIVPEYVATDDLVLSNGLDGIVWSCMVFIGGAVGGFATSFLGVTWSYIIDSVCYVVAALVTAYIGTDHTLTAPFVGLFRRRRRQSPYAALSAASGESGDTLGASASDGIQLLPMEADSSASPPSSKSDVPDEEQSAVDDMDPRPAGDGAAASDVDMDRAAAGDVDMDRAAAGDADVDRAVDGDVDVDKTMNGDVDRVAGGGGAALSEADKMAFPPMSSWRMFLNGMAYLRSEPYIFAVCHLKACLWLTVGIINLMNIRFAETIFVVGDQGSASLGITYMVVGVGTMITPIIVRRFASHTPKGIQIILVLGFTQLTVGAIGIALSFSFWSFLVANLVRSGSTSIIQVYSSLVLQNLVAEDLRGRVFTYEFVAMTVCTCLAEIFGGVAADVWGLTVLEIDGVAAGIAAVSLLGWALYFRFAPGHRDHAYRAAEGAVLHG